MSRRLVLIPLVIAVFVAGCSSAGSAPTDSPIDPSPSARAGASSSAETPSQVPAANASPAAPANTPAVRDAYAPKWADFAPPIAPLPDLDSGDGGMVNVMPTWVLPLKDAAWEKPVPGALFQLPDATKMYTFPDKDGTSKWTPDNPFLPASNDKHVDPLAYVGFSGSADLPKGAQMAFLLQVIAMPDSGSGRFYWDGQYISCEWTGGDSEPPAYGVARKSVHPTCTEENQSADGQTSSSTTGDLDAWKTFNNHVAELQKSKTAATKNVMRAIKTGNEEKIRIALQAERTADLIIIDWLDANPPRGCYTQVWSLDRAAAAERAKSRSQLKTYVSSNRQSHQNKANRLMERANETQARANAASDSVVCLP